jgi:hypothetical protein
MATRAQKQLINRRPKQTLVFVIAAAIGTRMQIRSFLPLTPRRSGLPAMSLHDADGPMRRWIDNLNVPTRVIVTFVVVAIVVGVIVWG